jgi:uncharacterized protein
MSRMATIRSNGWKNGWRGRTERLTTPGPVRDLAQLLAGARPSLSHARYVIAEMEDGALLPTLDGLFALIREEEGLTVVREDPDGDWARITMTIVSDLSAVGFTAAFARALMDRQIPANVVAAYHHDHILVPWDRRHDALSALETLEEDPT